MAPAIMNAIVDTMLVKDESIHQATSTYINVIYINEDVTFTRKTTTRWFCIGVQRPRTIVPELLASLGNRTPFYLKQGSEVPKGPEVLTWRIIFSQCGKLVGHFLVCGWLCIAIAFISRRAIEVTFSWDDEVTDNSPPPQQHLLWTSLPEYSRTTMCEENGVSTDMSMKVWVDANSLAICPSR